MPHPMSSKTPRRPPTTPPAMAPTLDDAEAEAETGRSTGEGGEGVGGKGGGRAVDSVTVTLAETEGKVAEAPLLLTLLAMVSRLSGLCSASTTEEAALTFGPTPSTNTETVTDMSSRRRPPPPCTASVTFAVARTEVGRLVTTAARRDARAVESRLRVSAETKGGTRRRRHAQKRQRGQAFQARRDGATESAAAEVSERRRFSAPGESETINARCTHSSVSAVRLLRLDGSVPLISWLPLRFLRAGVEALNIQRGSHTAGDTHSFCSAVRLPRLDGMVPFRWLLERSLRTRMRGGPQHPAKRSSA